jgi:hypothetical protein
MQPETGRSLRLHFRSEAEKARFDPIFDAGGEAQAWTLKGYEVAETTCVDALMRGVYGTRRKVILRNMEEVVAAGVKPLRAPPDPLSDDLVLCYRVGWQSRMAAAMNAFLEQRGALAQALAAGDQLVAAMTATAEAMDALAKALPATETRPTPSHLLSLHKPQGLRPKDLGALPSPRA